jgi:hypothetical protein
VRKYKAHYPETLTGEAQRRTKLLPLIAQKRREKASFVLLSFYVF